MSQDYEDMLESLPQLSCSIWIKESAHIADILAQSRKWNHIEDQETRTKILATVSDRIDRLWPYFSLLTHEALVDRVGPITIEDKDISGAVEKIMTTFPFQEVHELMEHMEWTWIGEDGVPSVEAIRDEASELLKEVTKGWGGDSLYYCSSSTGGLEATVWFGQLSLRWVPFHKRGYPSPIGGGREKA